MCPMSKSHVSLSKFLSMVLRHQPEQIGLTLDPQGWASIDELISKSSVGLTEDLIMEIVRDSPKQRFALSPDGKRIRANQGHSVPVDLGLVPVKPPETLYHGTAETSLDAIRGQGLKPGNRQHVHLSADRETAVQVGQRHGRPVVLTIAAGKAHRDGQAFWLSENGVWLTDALSPDYLTD